MGILKELRRHVVKISSVAIAAALLVSSFSPAVSADASNFSDPNVQGVKQIACGADFTLFLMNDGTVEACGDNQGDFGLQRTDTRSTPKIQTIPNLSGVKQVACGCTNAEFLMEDGTVKSCGVGDNTGLAGISTSTPVTISGLSGVNQIVCSGYDTFSIMNDGTVEACGDNSFGQLGMGDRTNRNVMTVVPGLNCVNQISSNEQHTVFLLDGTVKSCGEYQAGSTALGYDGDSLVPKAIPDLNGVEQVSTNDSSTNFLMNDGTVKVCGNFGGEELGSQSPMFTEITTVPNLNGVKQIFGNAFGATNTAFLMNDGKIKVCGFTNHGQLGLNESTSGYVPNVTIPTTIPGLNGVVQASWGYQHVMYLTSDGTVNTCGDNTYGQLGLGDTNDRNIPSPITMPSDSAPTTYNVTVTGHTSAINISVTHPATADYYIDANSSTPFTAAPIAVTNNTKVPVNVSVQSMSSASGGTIQFTDKLPGDENWNSLNVADTKKYIALGIGINDPSGWNSGYSTATDWAASKTPVQFGSLNADSTGKFSLSADYGITWDTACTAQHNLVFQFSLV